MAPCSLFNHDMRIGYSRFYRSVQRRVCLIYVGKRPCPHPECIESSLPYALDRGSKPHKSRLKLISIARLTKFIDPKP